MAAAPGQTTQHEYRPDIDGLRALAIGLVLVFHAFPSYLPAGFIGVDVFFVISGYLITGILLERRRTASSAPRLIVDFYQRRIKRIFPALILVLIASAVYGWFRLFPADYENLTKYIAGGAGFVSNFMLSAETGYFDQSADLKPLVHLWSLAIEEQFYLVWPLLILAIGALGRGRYFAQVLGAVTLISFAYGVFLTSNDPTAAYYSPLSRGWELGVGGVLAALHASGLRARPGRVSSAVSVAAFAAIPIGALLIQSSQFPGWQALVPVLASAAIIWFGKGTILDRRLLGTRPVVFIGLISYPLYLWHWVVLSFLRIEVPAPSGVMTVAAVIASFALACATYFLVEKPLRRAPLAKVSAIALVAMGLVLVFGIAATTLKWSGVQLTDTQQALSQSYDPRPAYRFGECFLDSATSHGGDFAPECDGDGTDRATLLLWGDSLSAQLYPGLASRNDLPYGIAQRTATSCPASAGDEYGDRGNCNEINATTRAWIAEHRPEVVVLDARWSEDDSARAAQIGDVVAFLRDNGVGTIALVGPTPDWYPDLKASLIRTEFPGDELPDRLPPPAGTWPGTEARDASLAALADSLGVYYYSPIAQLCTSDGCLIRVTPAIPAGLVTSDHDHMTAAASELVMRDFDPPAP